MVTKKADTVTTEMVKNAWTEMFKLRNYPISDFQVKGKNEDGKSIKLRALNWTEEQEKIKAENEAFFKDEKNRSFLNKKTMLIVFTIHQPWRYFKSPNDLIEILDKFKKYSFYIFVGYEIGKNGETEHLQGYIRFKKEMRLKNSEILNKFGTVNVYIDKAKGTDLDNLFYTTKDENSNINKWTYKFGNMSDAKVVRKNLDCSDFVDFVIKNNILITEETMDFYCADYRKNPSKAKSTIITLYSARMNKPYTALQHLTFCGASRSGKSLISRYLVLKTGIQFPRDVVKMEASGQSEKRMWFSVDTPIKRICWISEMNYSFPTKANLLSILDKESYLPVKGKDSVPNFFDILFLNSTNITPYTIYNITQWIKTSYQEITFRILEQGSIYFVFSNEEWRQIPQIKRQQMLINDYCGTVKKYPPIIYKNVTPTVPEYDDNLNFGNYEMNDSFKVQFDTSFLIVSETQINEIIIKKINGNEVFRTFNYFTVERVTLDDVEKDFISRLELVNSPLLKDYGHPQNITANALKEVKQRMEKNKKDVSLEQ